MIRFNSREGQKLLSRNPRHSRLDRSRIRRGEVDHPSAPLDCKRPLHPSECHDAYSSLGLDARNRIRAYDLVPARIGGSYPNIARPLDQIDAPIQPRQDCSSRLAELVPTPQTHECADLYSVLENLQLRRTPADMLVRWEKATERFALGQRRH